MSYSHFLVLVSWLFQLIEKKKMKKKNKNKEIGSTWHQNGTLTKLKTFRRLYTSSLLTRTMFYFPYLQS